EEKTVVRAERPHPKETSPCTSAPQSDSDAPATGSPCARSTCGDGTRGGQGLLPRSGFFQQSPVTHRARGRTQPEHTGEHAVAAEEGHEFSVLGGPVHEGDLICGSTLPQKLYLHLVLVGPEVGHRGEGCALLPGRPGQEVACCDLTLLTGVGPVLQTDPSAVRSEERRVGNGLQNR